MQKVARKGGVVLTSYGMLQRPQNTALLAEVNGRQFVWVSVYRLYFSKDSKRVKIKTVTLLEK